MKIKIFIAAMLILCGCNTAKKDFANVNKAILQHPGQTAKQLNDWRPCIPLVTVKDSSDYKKYMQELQQIADYYTKLQPDTVKDTLMEIWADTAKIKYYKRQYEAGLSQIKYLNKYIGDLTELCKDKPPIHDTTTVEDSRKIQILTTQLESSIADTKKIQLQADKKQIWVNWLIIIAIISGGYTAFSIYRKFTIPKL